MTLIAVVDGMAKRKRKGGNVIIRCRVPTRSGGMASGTGVRNAGSLVGRIGRTGVIRKVAGYACTRQIGIVSIMALVACWGRMTQG